MEGLLGCGKNPERLKGKRTDAGESPAGRRLWNWRRGARAVFRVCCVWKKKGARARKATAATATSTTTATSKGTRGTKTPTTGGKKKSGRIEKRENANKLGGGDVGGQAGGEPAARDVGYPPDRARRGPLILRTRLRNNHLFSKNPTRLQFLFVFFVEEPRRPQLVEQQQQCEQQQPQEPQQRQRSRVRQPPLRTDAQSAQWQRVGRQEDQLRLAAQQHVRTQVAQRRRVQGGPAHWRQGQRGDAQSLQRQELQEQEQQQHRQQPQQEQEEEEQQQQRQQEQQQQEQQQQQQWLLQQWLLQCHFLQQLPLMGQRLEQQVCPLLSTP